MIPRALLVLLLLAGAARAEPFELAGMRLDLPDTPGWARSRSSDGGLLLRRDLPPGPNGARGGNALIVVAPPRALGATPFKDAFTRFTQLEALPDGRPLQSREGITVNGHRMAWMQRCCRARNNVPAEAHFIGVEGPRGAIFAALMMVGLRGDATRPFEAEFEAMVRSLRPSPGDRALDFAAVPGGGGLDGLYTSLETGIRPNVFGGTDFYSENSLMLFDRGGIYARDLPAAGADIAAHCRGRPADCGFYRVAADGTLTTDDVQNAYGMIRREERPLVREGAGLRIGTRRWRAVEPFAPGTRLDGAWRYLHASSGTGAFSSGSIAIERVLTLTGDGRFTRTGFAGFSGSNETGGSRTSVTTSSRRPATSGRYRLEGYRLVLTGDDGAEEAFGIFRPDRGTDGLLVIGGANYLRRDAPPAGGPARKGG